MEQIYAYAYCRYSSHNQDDGWSIESQRIAIEKYARANGIRIKQFFIDEAMSGRTTNRAGYQKMMTAFQAHPEVKTLLIHKLDRMRTLQFSHCVYKNRIILMVLASFVQDRMTIALCSVIQAKQRQRRINALFHPAIREKSNAYR